MKKILHLILLSCILSITGCKDGKHVATECNTNSELETLNSPKAISNSESEKIIPPEKLPDSELEAYKEALIKVYPYLVLEDSVYRITISKEEAAKMQVPEKYYDRMVQDLEYNNYIIREEYNKKGLPITLTDPKIDTTLTILPN